MVRRFGAPFQASLGLTILVLLGLGGGCAHVGPPRPPLARIPADVGKVTLNQLGPDLQVEFTLPAKNADKSPITAYRSIEIATSLLPAGVQPGAAGQNPRNVHSFDAAALKLKPGQAAIQEKLDLAKDVGGVEGVVVVSVRYDNERGHWSSFSAPVSLTVGLVAAAPAELDAQTGKTGVVLEWTAPAWNIDGSTPPLLDGSVIVRRELPNGKFQAAGTTGPGQLQFTDTGFRPDARYEYAVLFYRQTPTGPIHSGLSPLVTIDTKDVFPPDAPAQLSLAGREGRIVLLWTPVADPDLAGYLVFRRDDPGSEYQQLTDKPIAYATYVDAQADPAKPHTYRVAAVDGHGNRSPMSPEAAWVPENQK